MVGLLFAMMLGGIFSLDFEAPQGYRSNGVYFPAVYFATLPLAAVLQAAAQISLQTLFKRLAYAATAIGVAGVLLLIGQSNLDTFFNKQRAARITLARINPFGSGINHFSADVGYFSEAKRMSNLTFHCVGLILML